LLIPILAHGETGPLPAAWENGEWSNLLLAWILPSGNFSVELLLRTAVSMEYLAEFFVM
jgi:hypothetical protein